MFPLSQSAKYELVPIPWYKRTLLKIENIKVCVRNYISYYTRVLTLLRKIRLQRVKLLQKTEISIVSTEALEKKPLR